MRAFFVVVIGIFLFSSTAIANEKSQAESSFKKKVEVFKQFFAKNPVYLSKENDSESPTGSTFRYYKYYNAHVSYELDDSDYLYGTIKVRFSKSESSNCGNFSISGSNYFTNMDDLRHKKNSSACYRPLNVDVFRFVFGYANGKWQFIKVVNVEYSPVVDLFLDSDLRVEENRRTYFYISDNDFWKVLTN